MRLPSTFFFRLDAQQATFVVGVFEIVFYFAAFLILCLVDLAVNPIKDDVDSNEMERARVVLQRQNYLTICEYYVLFHIFFTAIAVYAVQFRKRLLMVPWLVVRGLDLVYFIVQFIENVDLILAIPIISDTTMIRALFLGSTLAITLIGASCYCQLAAVTSFLKIRADANQDTPNGDVLDLNSCPVSAH